MVKMFLFMRNLHLIPFYDDADDTGDKGDNKDDDKSDDKNVADDSKIAKMSPAELLEFARDMRDQKRVAQGAESVLRKERNVLRDEKTAQDKKVADAEKTTADKLTEANTAIESMKAENKSMALKQTATTSLLDEGFPAKIVDLGITGLTDDNLTDKVKAFKKEFADYKIDPEKKPDHTAHRARSDKEPRHPAPHSQAAAAMDELEAMKGE